MGEAGIFQVREPVPAIGLLLIRCRRDEDGASGDAPSKIGNIPLDEKVGKGVMLHHPKDKLREHLPFRSRQLFPMGLQLIRDF